MSPFIRKSRGLLLLALCAITAGLTTAARADLIQIPAITFVNRGAGGTVAGDAQEGTLTNATGTYYAAVSLPNGVTVCKFVLVHRDNDGDGDVTARLMRKRIVIGGSPFDAAVEMARIQTTGGTLGVVKKRDTRIRQPVIDLSSSFYYAELVVDNNLIEVLGVEIEYGATC